MGAETVYLDHHSAWPLSEPARQAFQEALDVFGDPLKPHAPGRAARSLLEESRERIAAALEAQPDEVVFTSGGTESVELALAGAARARRDRGRGVVVSAIEHPAVLATGRALADEGYELIEAPVDRTGRLDVERFASLVGEPGTIVASVQHANHEVGSMQPIAEAARLARRAGAVFHTDACQTVGRVPVFMSRLDVDLLSLSAHKFGGPPGVGALVVRRGVSIAGHPGGDLRERRRRSGMESTAGVASMAAALDAALATMSDQAARQWALTDRLRRGLEERVEHLRLFGHPTQRAPHLVSFEVPGLDPEVLLAALEERGFVLDAGSVASGSPTEPSPVLEAMGFPGAVAFRASTGPSTSEADVDALLATLPPLVDELRRIQVAGADALAKLRPDEA